MRLFGKDRRAYNRMTVKANCVLFHGTDAELQGVLTDISDGDIGLNVFGEASLKPGDTCIVQFIDTLGYAYTHIITEHIVVNRVDPIVSGYHIGAVFVNKLSGSLSSYIRLLSAQTFLPINIFSRRKDYDLQRNI